MSRKGVIPPVSSANGILSDGETMEVLRRRMDAAENDTKRLVDQLTDMGFPPTSQPSNGPVSPFKVRTAEPDILHKNYESLVSRVCKAESALQTMKLSMLRIQADRDLNNKEKRVASDRLQQAAQAYECEIQRLNKENGIVRRERSQAWEMKEIAEQKGEQLQAIIDQLEKEKAELAFEAEDASSGRQKLQRRVGELKEQVAREASLRSSLEESQRALLERIKDMESVVQANREEVQVLNQKSLSLQRDSVRAQEETGQEREQRGQLEGHIQHLLKEAEEYRNQIARLEGEKQTLKREVSAVQEKYRELTAQLDNMQHLIQQKQESHSKVYNEHQSLKQSASETARKLAICQAQIEEQQQELAVRTENGQLAAELQLKLNEQARATAQQEKKCTQLQLELKDLRSQLASRDGQIGTLEKQSEKDAEHWRKQLRLAEEDKQRVLRDKEALLEEVNAAVDGMNAEKSRLEARIEEGRLEVREAQNARAALELENKRLLERVSSIDDHCASQQQVEQTLRDMVEQKNKLAYDKGKLQTQIDSYQRELEQLASAQTQLTQQRKLTATLGSKLNKAQTEAAEALATARRLEAELENSAKASQRSQRDFDLAIQSRDAALQENTRLQATIDELQQRNIKAASGVERNLEEARADNRKLSGTLESVMHSHTRLQQALEVAQQDLGKRDAAITDLHRQRRDLQQQVYQLQKEVENMQNKVASMEAYETSEVEPVRKNLHKLRADNSKMAASMETLLKANAQLQGTLEGLQDQLEQKLHVMQQLQQARESDQEAHKQQVRNYEERIANFKQQLMKERDKSINKSSRDVADVRRQMEELLGKNGELSRANTELRQSVTELQLQLKQQREKSSALKRQTEHLTRIRAKQDKALEAFEGLNEQIRELEKAKNYYMKKNKEQANTVKSFVAQISELQEEIRQLAQAQVETTQLLAEQEEQLSKERQATDQWRTKYRASVQGGLQDSRQREEKLTCLQRCAEERRVQAEDESQLMSASLRDAQNWFSTRLDSLQDELQQSQKAQGTATKECESTASLLREEKRKAEDVARRAQAMIKASRETVSRLADYAEETNKEATEQLYTLRAQLEAERENSQLNEMKLKDFQESSLRHTEELAREVESLKSRYSRHYDS